MTIHEFIQTRVAQLELQEKRAWAALNEIVGAKAELLRMQKVLPKPPEPESANPEPEQADEVTPLPPESVE